MSPGLRIDDSLTIPEAELRWTLPDDPAIGRADPTLGGFTTELSLDVTACAALTPRQREAIRDRVTGYRRTGDVIVSNVDGVITVKVDWIIEHPESADVARGRMTELLRDALTP